MEVITSGAFATLLMEGIKFIVRKWVVKDMSYDFNSKFYDFLIPVLTFIAIPILAILQVGVYTLPVDFIGWVRQLIVTAIGSLISVLLYNGGVKPLKEYRRNVG